MGVLWWAVWILGVDLARTSGFLEILNREDPCIKLCDKFSDQAQGVEWRSDGVKIDHMQSCCQRGCRFFNLVNLGRAIETEDFNATKSACESTCNEAYTSTRERSSCSVGCNFMAKSRRLDLISLLSAVLHMGEEIDSNNNNNNLPESEFITDPGLKKELMPGWWDINGFKLPQTFVKSVPKGSNMMDYNNPSDYSSDSDQNPLDSPRKREIHVLVRVDLNRNQILFIITFLSCWIFICLWPKFSKRLARAGSSRSLTMSADKIIVVCKEAFPSAATPGVDCKEPKFAC